MKDTENVEFFTLNFVSNTGLVDFLLQKLAVSLLAILSMSAYTKYNEIIMLFQSTNSACLM